MQVTSCKSVDFGAQIGSAGDVRVSSPPWGVRPQNCRVSGHGGHGSIEDDETKNMAGAEPRHMDFSDRVCQRAVKGAKGDYCTTGLRMGAAPGYRQVACIRTGRRK